MHSPWPARIATLVGQAVVVVGAALILGGTLGPWAQFKLFKNIDLSLPGFLFADGGLCLAVAALVLLGARRSSLLCLAGGLCVLGWATAARRDVPRRVKHQAIGAQMAMFPVNRLLDQFHIGDVQVGDWAVPDDQLLGPGLIWTTWGGGLLLVGAVLGLPGDPVAAWVYARTARRRCRACGSRWLAARAAQHCPACGTGIPGAERRCVVCLTPADPTDRHCISCGTALAGYGTGTE